MNTREPSLPIVIVGGGFAGVTLAQQLEKRLDPAIEIIVISRDNHMVFTPMLAEVAARTVSPLHVVVAGRQMTERVRWIAASVMAIDLEKRRVEFELSYGGLTSLEYGDLVLACGMDVNLREIPGMADHALPLKSIEDAFTLGNALIGKFEQATVETDPAVQARLLTTVVIGGGFSGVEIGGHLHDLARSIRRYYRFAEGVEPRTVIVHRGERVIPELQHETLSEYAVEKLRKNGVEVMLKTGVREISKTEVHLANGERLTYGVLAGTVGNTASAFIKESGLPLEKNRLKTEGTMQVEGRKSIWALGDCAVVPNAFDDKPSPPTAQFALRQAAQLAENIHRARIRQPLLPFHFRPQGLLASIGQRNGVAEVYGVKFSGIVAWFFWRAVYLAKMPTFSRKVGIAVDWFMNLFFPENLVRMGERDTRQIRREHYVAGDVVYRRGEPARTLYLVEKGSATVYVEEEEAVTHLRSGEHFGLSALEPHETQRSTTVTADASLDLVAFQRPPGREEVSAALLDRELERLRELRGIRHSWKSVMERVPSIDELHVADVMVKDPALLKESDTLEIALERICRAVSLPVVDEGGKLLASCTRADVSAALAQGKALDTRVGDFTSPATLTLLPDRSLRNAAFDYLRSGLDAVPVVDGDGRLVGMFGLIEAVRILRERI